MTARRSLPALRVQQWLPEWEEIRWKPDENRAQPPGFFYQFSIPASELRRLSGVYRRTTARDSAASDLGIQRSHDEERSREIGRFVRFGYPWSNLTQRQRQSSEFNDLRQPGWLPTAIVVNILTADQRRDEQTADSGDLVTIRDGRGPSVAEVVLPAGFDSEWKHRRIPPIEIIDGQHRLWAFGAPESVDTPLDFEVPVVAFHGLDLSWQAYLFYTINIKPKKINASLAFDLYPLLRAEEWLEKAEGQRIYLETRAQEIVDLLWSYADSPWHHRINMLGEPGHTGRQVTQAAWIRSLLASFVKRWDATRHPIGGLFGGRLGDTRPVLPWNLGQQAAFLIFVGRELRDAIAACDEPWARALREARPASSPDSPDSRDPAFYGRYNLLNQDQGIRVLLQTVNDLCFIRSDDLSLAVLHRNGEDLGKTDADIRHYIAHCREHAPLLSFVQDAAAHLATFDWRSSKAPGLSGDLQILKAGFRGSGGYNDLRKAVLRRLASATSTIISDAAGEVIRELSY